ncbi:Cut9-interacting protein scn1 [Podospora conica]|nr:Cut9-interacting protein scn1 [Schizothecium conicum]
MCRPSGDQVQPPQDGTGDESSKHAEPFPWHIGVYDAHCHVTDTMASVADIAGMRARVLTIMATRSQDQELVASVAAQHGISSRDEFGAALSAEAPGRVIPSFGWHPWFSHEFYDDSVKDTTFDPSGDADEQKTKHYTAVLSPAPDPDFVASLPVPRSLSSFIDETRARLLSNPLTLVGEIGIDRAFRLPQGWHQSKDVERTEGLTPGGRDGRLLSPHHVKLPHQVEVLKAQLRLAGELGRAVSVHGVQAHGVVFETLASLWKGHEKEVMSRRQQRRVAEGAEDFSSSEDDDYDEDDEEAREKPRKPAAKPYQPKPFPPRICLHSFSGPPQMLQQYLNPAIPAQIFFSFSVVVNLSTAGGEGKFAEVIRACPDDRLLVESDIHTAGEEMDQLLEQICRKVCEIKGWSLSDGVTRLKENYEKFLFGGGK